MYADDQEASQQEEAPGLLATRGEMCKYNICIITTQALFLVLQAEGLPTTQGLLLRTCTLYL
jgi:hypothetical protein